VDWETKKSVLIIKKKKKHFQQIQKSVPSCHVSISCEGMCLQRDRLLSDFGFLGLTGCRKIISMAPKELVNGWLFPPSHGSYDLNIFE
jgi:hypothetical protein